MKKFLSSHIMQLFISSVVIINILFHLTGFYDGLSKYLLRYSLNLSSHSLSTIFLASMLGISIIMALFIIRKNK